MANGMASLFVGASGLKSAQTALNTTAHNLSNINTEGYTRQQIAFRDKHQLRIGGSYASPSASVYGHGVGISEIRRIRDEFIDKAYRTENGRLGYYSNQYKAIEDVEDQFGELQGVTFPDALNNLYTAINELSKEPVSTVKRSSLIQNASALVTRSDAIYSGLKDYQETLNIDVANAINKINAYGEKIFSLNKQIAKIEGTGVENANDLRDQRDKALGELSEYIDISYYEVQGGEIYVNAGGVPFVTMSSYTQMSSRTNDDSTLLIPTWPAFERDVYPETELYSALTDKDKGGLKGTLLARGSIEVDYTDIPVKPDKADYDLTTVDGKAAYDKDYAKYQEKQEYYNKYIEQSVILSAIAGVDKLMNGIVTKINDVLCPEKDMKLKSALTDENGNEIMPNSYSYTVSDAVLYDKYKNEVKGFDNGDGTYSYESSEPLYTDKDLKNKKVHDEYISAGNDMCFVLNYYEFICSGIINGDFDEDSMRECLGQIVPGLEVRAFHFIRIAREISGSSCFCNFVAVSDKWSTNGGSLILRHEKGEPVINNLTHCFEETACYNTTS